MPTRNVHLKMNVVIRLTFAQNNVQAVIPAQAGVHTVRVSRINLQYPAHKSRLPSIKP
jgi:hypothetical protein